MKFEFKSNYQVEHWTINNYQKVWKLHFDKREQRAHENENIDKSRTKDNVFVQYKELDMNKYRNAKNYQVKTTPLSSLVISLSVVRDENLSKKVKINGKERSLSWKELIENEVGKQSKKEELVNKFIEDSKTGAKFISNKLNNGSGNRIINYHLHFDEVNPHIHITLENYNELENKTDRRYYGSKDKLKELSEQLEQGNKEGTELKELNNKFLVINTKEKVKREKLTMKQLKEGKIPRTINNPSFVGELIESNIKLEQKNKVKLNKLKQELEEQNKVILEQLKDKENELEEKKAKYSKNYKEVEDAIKTKYEDKINELEQNKKDNQKLVESYNSLVQKYNEINKVAKYQNSLKDRIELLELELISKNQKIEELEEILEEEQDPLIQSGKNKKS